MNALLELNQHGQSYWLDNLERRALRSGELSRRVEHDGLRGVTSNPKTFHDAVLKSADYDEQIAAAAATGLSPPQIYEDLSTTDVQRACDVLRRVYDTTLMQDGYVSLEVSPHLAYDSQATVAEARRLWARVNRPNLMIKIPGTEAGIGAIEEALYHGLNINITLLFSIARYRAVREAYVRAQERRLAESKPIQGVRSVASFFLSRIDVLCDRLIQQRTGSSGAKQAPLLGKVAIASAKLAYQDLKTALAEPRWSALARAGAAPQRLLWASTGTKNPKYPDVMYVKPLIGGDTISTMPEQTIAAFADHGTVSDSLEGDVDHARTAIAELARLGIDLQCVTQQLESEGVQQFIDAYDELLHVLEERSKV
jgi:transketolase